MDTLAVGDVLEVVATDPGSMGDFRGSAKNARHAALRDQHEQKDETGKTICVPILERVT